MGKELQKCLVCGEVMLPCKLGDTVYYIPKFGSKAYCGIQSGRVQMIGITSRSIRIKISEHHPHNKDFTLGQTVFLTHEDAEKALLNMEKML